MGKVTRKTKQTNTRACSKRTKAVRVVSVEREVGKEKYLQKFLSDQMIEVGNGDTMVLSS
jgi:hypothetical protein